MTKKSPRLMIEKIIIESYIFSSLRFFIHSFMPSSFVLYKKKVFASVYSIYKLYNTMRDNSNVIIRLSDGKATDFSHFFAFVSPRL